MSFFAAGDYDREMRDAMIQPNLLYVVRGYLSVKRMTHSGYRPATARSLRAHCQRDRTAPGAAHPGDRALRLRRRAAGPQEREHGHQLARGESVSKRQY